MKQKLTKQEYFTLQALLYMCERAYSELKEVEAAAEELLDLDDGNHSSIISDAIYGDEQFDAKKFCKRYNIKITK